jgi:hypothetical protein
MHIQTFKTQYIIFILFLFSYAGIAQNRKFEWVKTIGAPSFYEYGISMVIDSNKSVIVTGSFRDTTDFDAGPGIFNMVSKGSPDIYITEYDTSGKFKWAKQIGGIENDEVYRIQIAKNGDLLVLGFFHGTADFDPGVAVFNLTSNSGASGFLLRLDNNGNFISAKKLPYGTNNIDIDPAGNIILGGEFFTTQDFDPGPGIYNLTTYGPIGQQWDMFIEKLDPDGNFVWVKQIRNLAESQNQQYCLKVDVEGNILLGGSYSSTMDFDPGPDSVSLSGTGFYKAFILKLDNDGNFKWVKQFPGNDYGSLVNSLATDKLGNVYSTGTFFGIADFDPGPAVFPLNSVRSCFISKLDKSGNFLFAKSLSNGLSTGQVLTLDSSNNLYVSGGYEFGTDLDPGPGVYSTIGTGIFVDKLNENGNFIWGAGYYSNTNSFQTRYADIKVDILKNVYLTGAFISEVNFDPGPGIFNVTAAGNTFDMFLHKLSQCGNTLKQINVQSCGSYTLNGITYSKPGTYFQTLVNSVGCDSIVQVNLIRNDKSSVINTVVCDSYNWGGRLLTSSGVYRDTFNLTNGCDSTVELNLSITKNRVSLNQTACGSYLFGGKLITNSGVYTDSLKLSNGCDSITTLTLTIKSKPTPNLGRDTSICKGETIMLSPGNFTSYVWNNATTGNSLTINDAGTYKVTVTGDNGCNASDSVLVSFRQCDCTLNILKTKVYPNPFKGFLLIDKQPTSCKVKLKLLNSIGQLVLNNIDVADGLNKITLPVLSGGVYFFKLYTDEKVLMSGKIIKQ